MYCPKCGTESDDNAYRCVECSGIIQVIGARSVARPIEYDPGMRMLLPVGRSLLAIFAGYAGLFAVLFFPAPLALILGILAVVDIKKHPDKIGMGRAGITPAPWIRRRRRRCGAGFHSGWGWLARFSIFSWWWGWE